MIKRWTKHIDVKKELIPHSFLKCFRTQSPLERLTALHRASMYEEVRTGRPKYAFHMSAHHTYRTGSIVVNSQPFTGYGRLWASAYRLKAKQTVFKKLQFVEGYELRVIWYTALTSLQLNSYYVTTVLFLWSIRWPHVNCKVLCSSNRTRIIDICQFFLILNGPVY